MYVYLKSTIHVLCKIVNCCSSVFCFDLINIPNEKENISLKMFVSQTKKLLEQVSNILFIPIIAVSYDRQYTCLRGLFDSRKYDSTAVAGRLGLAAIGRSTKASVFSAICICFIFSTVLAIALSGI